MQYDFHERVEYHERIYKKYDARARIIGLVKLLLVVLLCVVLYFVFANGLTVTLSAAGAPLLIALVWLWAAHLQANEKADYAAGMASINQRHLDRRTGEWLSFTDTGKEFADPEHPFACDLDLAGEKSFFQFLNTTHTWHGRQAFAGDLIRPQYTGDEIRKRQRAVAELSLDMDFSNHMEYYLSKIGADSSAQNLVNELSRPRKFLQSKTLKVILMFAPIFTFLFVAVTILFRMENFYLPGAVLVGLQTFLWVFGMQKTQGYLKPLSGLPYRLSAYGKAIDMLNQKDYTSDLLKEIQEKLSRSDLSAAKALKALDKICGRVRVRHNGILYVLLNALLLWDFECAIMFEEWKEKYAGVAESWFLALGEFESLLCLSNLPGLCNHTCLPDITEGKSITAKEIGHPLIPNDVRMNNDISCTDNIFIISGSNMSGKTTLLRTIGVNLALARSGSFVCAKQMTCPPFSIVTSIRVSDDLSAGVSTFYAELKRIKTIIEHAKRDPFTFFLIDEIFRGTNSVDRLSGARTVLSKLDALGAVGIITTHDLELCEIAEKHPRIQNYSFSEHYLNDKICFDYKMKAGKSNTTNARFLMKMVGI